MSNKEEHGFLKGAAVLSIAGIIIKILGAVYRIPLSNILKSEGMGYYQTAYPFYNLLLTISTAGFPVAIAKLVSEKRSLGDYESAHKVFKVSLVMLSIFGLLSSGYLFFNAENIVGNLGNNNAYYALVSLVPALVFVPIMSTFRGYFQGSQNMAPTAISQIFEQLFRVISGLLLTTMLISKDFGIPAAAGGASMGGTIGALAGTLAVVFIYMRKKSGIDKERANSIETENYGSMDIVKDLLVIAIPITLGAAITPIMDFIDIRIVLKRLQTIGYTEFQANELYGNLKGMAQTLINLPQVFAVALSMSLVPAISNARATDNTRQEATIIKSGIKVTLLIGLPCAIGFFVLGEPIIQLLYFKNSPETIAITGRLLQALSMGVVFLTLVQSLAAILQGLGKPIIPAINLLVGAVVKAILTFVLSGMKSVNIYGAAISTVAAYGIAAILDLVAVAKYSSAKINFNTIFKKPIISAVGMGVMVKIADIIFRRILGGNKATFISIFVGVITYVVLLFITGAVTDEDLKLLPKGDKLISILDKFRKDNK